MLYRLEPDKETLPSLGRGQGLPWGVGVGSPSAPELSSGRQAVQEIPEDERHTVLLFHRHLSGLDWLETP